MCDTPLFGELPVSVNPASLPPPPRKEKCGECAHIQRWRCGNSFFHYCGARHSNRTDNGLLKVKCKPSACGRFEKNQAPAPPPHSAIVMR
jgi:hypothetical protein